MKTETEDGKNRYTVRLSDESLRDINLEDLRLRRNIQWGIVQGLFLFFLLMIPVMAIIELIIHN